MKLELVTPLVVQYGEHNEPYYDQEIELQNDPDYVFDSIHTIICHFYAEIGDHYSIKLTNIECFNEYHNKMEFNKEFIT